MSNILKKLDMMNISYSSLNDWSIQFEYGKDGGNTRVKFANVYLDTLSEEGYDIIEANKHFIFADKCLDVQSNPRDYIEHTLDIFIRTSNNPVAKLKKYYHDCYSYKNAEVIIIQDRETDLFIVINKEGKVARISKTDQRILRGMAASLEIRNSGGEKISVFIDTDVKVLKDRNTQLKKRELIAFIDKELKLTFTDDIVEKYKDITRELI